MMMGVACLCRRAHERRGPYPDLAEVKIRTFTDSYGLVSHSHCHPTLSVLKSVPVRTTMPAL